MMGAPPAQMVVLVLAPVLVFALAAALVLALSAMWERRLLYRSAQTRARRASRLVHCRSRKSARRQRVTSQAPNECVHCSVATIQRIEQRPCQPGMLGFAAIQACESRTNNNFRHTTAVSYPAHFTSHRLLQTELHRDGHDDRRRPSVQ